MNLIPSLLNYLELNPFMAITIVFVIAMAEALIVIGLFVPSTAVLVGAGTLVGLGKLSFWPLFLAGAVGAIIGDAVSYWAGHYYGRQLKEKWPLKHYPDLMLRGEQFFAAHGMKSIFIGRFIPAVKAIVPGIAGMLRMNHLRFSVINIVSALVWSAVHLIPGLFIGQGLAAANQVSARLAVLLLAVLILVALAAYLARLIILWGVPLFGRWQAASANWAASQQGACWQRIGRVLHPDHPHALTLLFWSATLVAAVTWFAGLTEDVLAGGAILALDQSVANLLQSVRNAPGDALLVAITMLGDGVVLTVLAVGMVGWLLWRRAWYAAGTVTLALLAAAGFVPLAKMLLHRARPMALYTGADAYSFPSGHATLAATLFGILALLVSVGMPRWGRAAVCSVAAAIVAMIAFSRVYLHAHWPSDVVAGLAFGLVMIAVVALALVRLDGTQIAPRRLAAFALVLLLAGYALHLVRDYDSQQHAYTAAQERVPHRLSSEDWLGIGWQQLAAYRTELSGHRNDPFILQWSGPVEHLQARLEGNGWQAWPAWRWAELLAYFNTANPVEHYRPLPRLHEGRPARLTLSRPRGQPDERLVLRLWASGFTTEIGGQESPILLGELVTEYLPSRLGLLRLVQSHEPSTPLQHRFSAVLQADGTIATQSRERVGISQQYGMLLAYPVW